MMRGTAIVLACIAACGQSGVARPPSLDASTPEPRPSPDAGPSCADDEPADPVAFGACAVKLAQMKTGDRTKVRIVVAAGAAESFQVDEGDETVITGGDAVGAMYGALELAERIELALPRGSFRGSPAITFRAANLFLVLPRNERVWWFHEKSFWKEYLDLLARARIDVLDLHGMYNMENTIFPNALLYFGSSATFPAVGAPDRAKNAAMLDTVVKMAAARGIKVALMTYRSDTSLLGDDPGPALDDAQLKLYTREATADVARKAPGLAWLGFRIGESGRPAAWFKDSFLDGVKDAATGARAYTRTWLSTKSEVLALAASADHTMMVQAKYNGEQLGAPYAIAGGWMSGLSSYSYEEYLNAPAPYDLVFQVRAGGTHRIFRQASFHHARRTVENLRMSPRIHGFTLEPAHAFYPQRDDYHARAEDRFSPWTFRRDELFYLLFGRLAYEPKTPDTAFRKMLGGLWDAVQSASEIVPWIQNAHTCGPDHRDFAPELELGGDVRFFATPGSNGWCKFHGAFDPFAIALPHEAASDLVAGTPTTRLSPLEVARIVMDHAGRARAAGVFAAKDAKERDIVRECVALADLGDYFGRRLRAATALAVYTRTGKADWMTAARAETAKAHAAWRALAEHTAYIAPIDERLRMSNLGLFPFHWRGFVPRLDVDGPILDEVEAAVKANPPVFNGTLPAASAWLDTPRADGPGLASLDVTPRDPGAPTWTVTARFLRPVTGAVRILWKPFPSNTDWRSAPATQQGDAWVAQITGERSGALFAVEVAAGWRYPDVTVETPYRALPP